MADYNNKLPSDSDAKVDGMLKEKYSDGVASATKAYDKFKKIKKVLNGPKAN